MTKRSSKAIKSAQLYIATGNAGSSLGVPAGGYGGSAMMGGGVGFFGLSSGILLEVHGPALPPIAAYRSNATPLFEEDDDGFWWGEEAEGTSRISFLPFNVRIVRIVVGAYEGTKGTNTIVVVHFEVQDRTKRDTLRLKYNHYCTVDRSDKKALSAEVRQAMIRMATHEIDEALLVDGYHFTDPHPEKLESAFRRPEGLPW